MDEMIQEILISEIYKISNEYATCNKEIYGKPKNSIFSSWEYPIQKDIPIEGYHYKTAQSLLEIIYYTSWYNTIHKKKETLTYPKHFNDASIIKVQLGSVWSNIAYIFWSESENILLFVFSGTYNSSMLFENLNYNQTFAKTIGNGKLPEKAKIHKGYCDLYHATKKYLYEAIHRYTNAETKIITTGVSLGGALSSVAKVDLSLSMPEKRFIHYSFGSPRVWNPIAAEYIKKHIVDAYRVQNSFDIITKVPLPIMPCITDVLFCDMETYQYFSHVFPLIVFFMDLESFSRNHGESYLRYYNISIKKCD
jgi:predicted lipase